MMECQYAYRAGRSTDTALHHLVNKIETQLGERRVCPRTIPGCRGAFDTTSYTAIKEAMHRHDISPKLIDWTQNMLSDRTLTVDYGDKTLSGLPVRRAVFSLRSCGALR